MCKNHTNLNFKFLNMTRTDFKTKTLSVEVRPIHIEFALKYVKTRLFKLFLLLLLLLLRANLYKNMLHTGTNLHDLSPELPLLFLSSAS